MLHFRDRFEIALRARPDKVAVVQGNRSLTYRELDLAIGTVCSFFESLGLSSNDRVAVCMTNSIDYLTIVYAAVRFGLTYVPLNHTQPIETVSRILETVEPKVLFADAVFADSKIDTAKLGGVLVRRSEGANIDEVLADIGERRSGAHQQGNAADIAYVMFTSGSTGVPKGVCIGFAGIDNFVTATIQDLGLTEETVALSIPPYYFDASLGTIFGVPLAGGTLVIYESALLPRILGRTLLSNRVTYLAVTPGIFKVVVDSLELMGGQVDSIRSISIGGDKISRSDLQRIKQYSPRTRVFNRYGPTECTAIASSHEIGEAEIFSDEPISIGKAHSGMQYFLFSENGDQVVEANVKGILFVGGVQVMLGYWDDPAQTAAVIDSDKIAGLRLYKTNDICSFDEQGHFYFHERAGGLLKRSGVRIYLSEIEQTLGSIDLLEDVTCIEVPTDEVSLVLAAIVLKPQATRKQLVDWLHKNYPPQYVPDEFVELDQLPYTTVGKIDKKVILASRKQ